MLLQHGFDMRIILSTDSTAREIDQVVNLARHHAGDHGSVSIDTLDGRMVITIAPHGDGLDPASFRNLKGVDHIEDTEPIYSLAGKNSPESPDSGTEKRLIEIPFINTSIGGDDFIVMAGPCAVENEDDLLLTARTAKNAGAKILRGGAFKPRTSPYSFQGIGDRGLAMLARVREEVGIGIITEAMEPAAIGKVGKVADIIQIGSRNMQNFPLLREAGKQPKPILLKRGMSATLEEWLGAAEYILAEGNPNVILCERGIRTFSSHSRHTLDIGVIPVIRERTTLPVIVDPSHATGSAARVPSMAMAALAAGADGLLLEIHPEPGRAMSDGFQTLTFAEFNTLMKDLAKIAGAVGREIQEFATP